jgi:DNA-binding response OmpR family regulator
MRVLIVEDERELANAIADGLRQYAMAVDVAYDGADGLDKSATNEYDVVILDRDLPRIPGDKVCASIVASHTGTRVLMLTAAVTVRDRVSGLGLGADDYLVKPFAFDELVARVQALGRRSRQAALPVIERRGIKIDTHRGTVHRNDREISLSRKEYAVLVELLRADGGVVSTEYLLEKAWDEQTDPFTNVVRFTIMKVRRKLGEPDLIETLPGTGYRIL